MDKVEDERLMWDVRRECGRSEGVRSEDERSEGVRVGVKRLDVMSQKGVLREGVMMIVEGVRGKIVVSESVMSDGVRSEGLICEGVMSEDLKDMKEGDELH